MRGEEKKIRSKRFDRAVQKWKTASKMVMDERSCPKRSQKIALACATAEPVTEFIGNEETTKRKDEIEKRAGWPYTKDCYTDLYL
jgi:hypothetical protein